VPTSASPERYEQLAKEHRAGAERISDPVLKRSLLQIAKNYDDMAAHVRRVQAMSPTER
jgi:hypothetical protein